MNHPPERKLPDPWADSTSCIVVVASDGEAPSGSELEGLYERLHAFGPGDVAVFDLDTPRAREFSWILRSPADLHTTYGTLYDVVGFERLRDCSFFVARSKVVHGRPPCDPVEGRLHRHDGVRKVALHRRRPGVEERVYGQRFHEHGLVAVVHHANASCYRQSRLVPVGGYGGASAEGLSEHWYGSLELATSGHFAREESEAVVTDDVDRWLDRSTARGGYGTSWSWG